MSKVKVLKEFVDRESGVYYAPGSEFEGTQKRVKELGELEFVEAAADKKQEKKSSKDGE